MSDNITRCPKCQTSFRVGEAHLNSAKGAVRCGSCLNVFNAREHLIPSKKPISADITSPKQKSEAQSEETPFQSLAKDTSTLNTSDHHDTHSRTAEEDFLISDDMEKTEDKEKELNDEFLSAGETFSSSDDYDSSLFERAALDTSQEDDDIDDDESWALNLLKDDEELKDSEEPSNPIETERKSDVDSVPPISDSEIDKTLRNIHVDEEPIYADFDEGISEDEDAYGISEDSYEEEAQDSNSHEQNDYEEPPEESPEYTNRFQIVTEEEESYHKPIFEVFEERSEEELNTELANQYLESIEPEPVEFSFKTHSNIWQSKLLWGGLSLIAGLALAAQVAWIKFDSWSIQKPYRQYYAIACNILSCDLPVLIDRSKIKTANLVVRSHPKAANALIVDAILQNTAIFEQTFPVLDLVFTNSQEKVVAARRLNPDDYLGGELAGKTHMPVRQPIHIAIEIEDPGEKAVGYKISIAD